MTRTHTTVSQQVRQPVSRLIKLPIRHRTAPTTHRHRLRGAATWAANRAGTDTAAGAGAFKHRPVADLIQPGMLSLIEHINRRHPPGRIGGHRHQHPLQPVDQRFDAGRVEHVGVVFDTKTEFVARLQPAPKAGSGWIPRAVNSVTASSWSPANAAVSTG